MLNSKTRARTVTFSRSLTPWDILLYLGGSYISQLVTRQKALRVEQVLLILNVIGIDAAEF